MGNLDGQEKLRTVWSVSQCIAMVKLALLSYISIALFTCLFLWHSFRWPNNGYIWSKWPWATNMAWKGVKSNLADFRLNMNCGYVGFPWQIQIENHECQLSVARWCNGMRRNVAALTGNRRHELTPKMRRKSPFLKSSFPVFLISPFHIIITMTGEVLQRCHGMFLAMRALTRPSLCPPLTSYILLLLQSASLSFLEIRFILAPHPTRPFMAYICYGHTEFHSSLSLPNKT